LGRRIPPSLCARCKGYKKLCGLPTCPILERFRTHATIVSRRLAGNEVEGATPPSIVVGESGYPRVPLLYHVPPGERGEAARYHDAPIEWARRRETLRTIISLRSSMVAAAERFDARKPEVLYEKEISVAAVSTKPVDSEVMLEKKPIPSLRFDGLLAPLPPSAPARMLRISSNPTPPKPLDSMMWDDVAASDAVMELYRRGVDVYTLIPALSLGLLGRRRQRRLVPTRWAITAVDSTIGNRLIAALRTEDSIDEYEVYHASYLGNYFTVILAPHHYAAEMIEVWHPLTPWTRRAAKPVVYRISESLSLRQSIMDGGYIAARLAVAEHLYRRRRQAAVIILREITRDYYAPIGNWHIRETVRRALSGRPLYRGSDIGEALEAALSVAKSQVAREELKHSRLARRLASTRRLDEFLQHSAGRG